MTAPLATITIEKKCVHIYPPPGASVTLPPIAKSASRRSDSPHGFPMGHTEPWIGADCPWQGPGYNYAED